VSLERVSHAEWFPRFKAALESLDTTRRQHSPLQIIELWERPQKPGTAFDATHFRAAVAELTGWEDVPQLGEGFVRRCLKHMDALGLIDGPLHALPEPHAPKDVQ
jgi:fatty acid CoA ligase FadD9